MGKKIGTFFEALLLFVVKKRFDYLCLAVEINVLMGNERCPENVDYAIDVNLLALCGPAVWRELAVTCLQPSST
jgi:hypothetical protein